MNSQMPGGNGHLSDQLLLSDIVYLGSHNCAMAKCYGWIYAQQNVNITEQFEKYGARHFKVLTMLQYFFNYQIEKYNKLTKNLMMHISAHQNAQYLCIEIVVAHEGDGGSNCKLSVVQRALKAPEKAVIRLKEIADLAYKYPSEIFVLKLESKLLCNTKTNGTHGWDPSLIGIMLQSMLAEIRIDQRAISFQGNTPPTLGWCRENNKNILVTIEPRNQLTDEILAKYVHYSYTVSAQVDWEIDPLKQVTDGKICRGVTNNSDGSIWSPFLEIHLNPEVSFRPDSQYRMKYNEYQHVRRRFLAFNNHCKKMPNFVVADFIDQGGLAFLVDDINNISSSNGKFIPEQFEAL